MKQRMGEADFVPAEICDGGADGCIANGYANHEAQGKTAVDQWSAKFALLHVFSVKVQWRRVVRYRTEPDIVGFGNRPGDAMLKGLPDLEFFEIVSRHFAASVLVNAAS